MGSLSVFVILGAKNPLFVVLTSNCAAALGVAVPIPIWACVFDAIKKIEQFAKENPVSEDDIKRQKDEIQKIIDKNN
jgi:aspartate/methionine/tyrosine aminotransferase